MDDEIFRINVLVLIKEHFLDVPKTLHWLKYMEQFIDNDFKRAFWQGGYDYVHFVNCIQYTAKPELKLPTEWFPPAMRALGTERDFRLMREDAIPQWTYYNIFTRGCLEVC